MQQLARSLETLHITLNQLRFGLPRGLARSIDEDKIKQFLVQVRRIQTVIQETLGRGSDSSDLEGAEQETDLRS